MASGKQPITRHPLFPATVALWFGALFGIGSLAVRPALIESAIVALKLDALIAVPIGPTTQILIALALAGAGGLLGARLARRIGRPKPVARPRKRTAAFGTRGTEEEAASPATRAARRTQLAIPDDGHGEPAYYDRAPVPGGAQILDVSQFGIEGFEPEAEQTSRPDTTPILSAADEIGDNADFLPGPAYDEAREASAQSASSAAAAEIPPASPALPRFVGEEAAAAPSLFAQPLNARVSEVRWQDDIAAEAEPTATESETKTDAEPPHGDASAAQRIASARLDELAPIELLERLAISLREKRNRAALATNPLPADPAIVTQTDMQTESGDDRPAAAMTLDQPAEPELDEESAEHEDEPVALAPEAPPVPTIPAALRPVGLDADDDEDHLPSFIPPRRIGGAGLTYSAPVAPQNAPGSASTVDASSESLDLEGGYSSLLNLSRPAVSGQRFVRIEEPESGTNEIEPVVVFPGQASDPASAPRAAARNEGQAADTTGDSATDSAGNSRDPEETERALRSALANIQRMSGAA